MSRDPDEYPDPDILIPSSRICPGCHLVEATVFIMCASILHVFDIGPELDQHGEPVPVRMKFNETSLTA